MKIGIGIPTIVEGLQGAQALEWARKADAGPFSSISIVDRPVYPSYEPMMMLAALAAVTTRVRLLTGILILPLRNAGIWAKEAATIDSLSNGRLTIGFGVGRREDDFAVCDAPFHDRGKRFNEQLDLVKRIWAGEPVLEGVGPAGPAPSQWGGPEMLFGGGVPAALRRVARWGDGFYAGGGDASRVADAFKVVEGYWREEGRSGSPRLVGGVACALGSPSIADRGAGSVFDYYKNMGEEVARNIVRGMVTSPHQLRQVIHDMESTGMDELVFRPHVEDVDQIDRLAEAIG